MAEPAEPSDLVIGADGLARCFWATGAADYLAYHDEEWGRPLHGQEELFERLTLECFQSGLSWLVILRKRANFRAAFGDFDIEAIAAYDEEDVDRLLGDGGIVRNRAKILATVANARATLAMDRSLDDLLWSYAPADAQVHPATRADVPAVTPESTAMSKDLKRRGFSFVGPTTCYAAMQAVGITDDHLVGCHRSFPPS